MATSGEVLREHELSEAHNEKLQGVADAIDRLAAAMERIGRDFNRLVEMAARLPMPKP